MEALIATNVILVLAVATLLFRNYLPTYFSKKGENLATKEDIAAITREVENVRNEFALRFEGFAQKNRLSLAALDRRLEVLQEAYTRWWHLFHSVHSENVGDEVQNCQAWWTEHCVYLSAEVRDAFLDAFHAAHLHRGLLRPEGEDATKLLYENWEKIERCGQVILKAAGLPGFGTEEAKEVRAKAEPSTAFKN